MTGFRYPQFCALARAAEILGERWTLLIVRELLQGPQRFSDLRRRLSGVSPSVLTSRLASLVEAGVVRRGELEPPAASTVYELTETGAALEPAVRELVRWGSRFLTPPACGDLLEPEWLKAFLASATGKAATPACSYELRMSAGKRDVSIHIAGGPEGTVVSDGGKKADVVVMGSPLDIASVLAGFQTVEEAVAAGRIRIDGKPSVLLRFPELFEIDMMPRRSIAKQDSQGREGENE